MRAKTSHGAGAIPIPDDLRVHPIDDDLVWLSFEIGTPTAPPDLTPAEQEIALLVHAGRTNRDIADARGVSVKTVGNQLESIYRKLGIQSRIELVLVLQGRRPT